MKNSFKKGFTLIELLVVVAIIGILAAVVLASLNTARAKGSDAAIKSDLANARAQAEIWYDSNGTTYTNLCDSTNVSPVVQNFWRQLNAASVAGGNVTVPANCSASASQWVASTNLRTDPAIFWCVDSNGYSNIGTADTTNNVCTP